MSSCGTRWGLVAWGREQQQAWRCMQCRCVCRTLPFSLVQISGQIEQLVEEGEGSVQAGQLFGDVGGTAAWRQLLKQLVKALGHRSDY